MSVLGSLDHLAEAERLLLEAVEQRDLEAVQQQLAAGANPSAADDQGLTALHVAALVAQGPVVDALLAAGADASAKSSRRGSSYVQPEGFTPLLCMVKRLYCPWDDTHMSDTVRFLFPWDPSKCVVHPAGGLIKAPHKCSPHCHDVAGIVQQLVAAGAQVQMADRWFRDYTPLHYAAQAGCSTVVRSLLQAGADSAVTSWGRWSVLHAAASSGSLEVVQQVLGALGPSRAVEMVGVLGAPFAFEREHAPLHLAAKGGYLEVAEALVAAGADVEQEDSAEVSVLQLTLIAGHCHLVPLLVTPGNANKQFDWGGCTTPLHFVATCPRYAYPTEQGPEVSQPLAAAAARAAEALLAAAAARAVEALLAAGADARVKDHTERVPAVTAVYRGTPEVLQVLLEHEIQHHIEQRRRQQPLPPPLPPPPPQQQQQQQQQQQRSEQQGSQPLVLDILLEVAAVALSRGQANVWSMFACRVADALGEVILTRLWHQAQEQLAREEKQQWLFFMVHHTSAHAMEAWANCWAAACKQLAAQRSGITERIEQLVVGPHHHQQQQQLPVTFQVIRGTSSSIQMTDNRSSSSSSSSSKRPRLARELRMLLEQQPQQRYRQRRPPVSAASTLSVLTATDEGGSSSRAARARARDVSSTERHLQAAAVRGDESGVRATLGQLPDRAAGLTSAAAAAGAAGQWGLCMRLLRELVMLDEAKGKQAVRAVHEAVSSRPVPGAEPWTVPFLFPASEEEGREERAELKRRQRRLPAAYLICDALCSDWLAVRQEMVRERREAVVAAAGVAACAAAGAACV
jgi:ankyrin repeat protein